MTVKELLKRAENRVPELGVEAIKRELQELSGAADPQYLFYDILVVKPSEPFCPFCAHLMRREVDKDVDGVVHIHWTCNCTPTEAEIDSVR